MTQIERKSINKLLGVNLDIPDYQRPIMAQLSRQKFDIFIMN